MKNSNNTFGETIVAFQISGGGGNRTKREFIGANEITDFTNDLYLRFENMPDQDKYPNICQALHDADVNPEDIQNTVIFKRLEKIGYDLGDLEFVDECGNPVDLTYKESLTGVGRIDIDGYYDTTYCCRLEDCDDDELKIILESNNYVDSDIIDWIKNETAIGARIAEDEFYDLCDEHNLPRSVNMRKAS